MENKNKINKLIIWSTNPNSITPIGSKQLEDRKNDIRKLVNKIRKSQKNKIPA